MDVHYEFQINKLFRNKNLPDFKFAEIIGTAK